jgi:hypothetical protein
MFIFYSQVEKNVSKEATRTQENSNLDLKVKSSKKIIRAKVKLGDLKTSLAPVKQQLSSNEEIFLNEDEITRDFYSQFCKLNSGKGLALFSETNFKQNLGK